MSGTETQTAVKISVTFPVTGYRRRVFFNRFVLSAIGEHLLAHFGLVDDTGLQKDCFSCILTRQTLTDNKALLTGFLTKVGLPEGEVPKWGGPTNIGMVEMANVLNVSQSNESELVLGSFPIMPTMIEAKKRSGPIDIDPIAILRTEPELLKHFIAQLYKD